MKTKENDKKELKKKFSIILIIFIVMVVTSINACGYLGILGELSWKEEVLLHDGSKIIVKRWQKRGGPHTLGSKPGILEYSLSFEHPVTKEIIKWKDGPTEDIDRASLKLVALHIKDSTPYVITTTYLGCRAFNKWGRPNPNYVIFKYEENKWKRIELSELPSEFININLVIDTTGYDEENAAGKGLITTKEIKELNKSLTQKIHKTIVRTPFKQEDEDDGRCPEMIYDGHGGWTGINAFKREASYEDCLKACRNHRINPEYCPCARLFNNKKGE
jgi:hypothetical protein